MYLPINTMTYLIDKSRVYIGLVDATKRQNLSIPTK